MQDLTAQFEKKTLRKAKQSETDLAESQILVASLQREVQA